MKHLVSLIAMMILAAFLLLLQTGCLESMRSVLRLPTAPTRPMAEPTTAERACIGVPIIVVRPIGMKVPGVPMASGAPQSLGATAREAPRDGGEAPLPGIMDRGVSAASAAARLRGVVAPAAQRDGGAARPHGAAVPAPSMELAVAPFHGDGEAVKRTRTAISTT